MTWTVRAARAEDLQTVVAFNQQMALDTEGKQLEEAVLTAGVKRALSDASLARYFVIEDRVIEDRVIEDRVIEDRVIEDRVIEDRVIEDRVIEDRVIEDHALDGGAAVVGQLMLTEEWSDWRNGRFLWIQSVYVRPSHRRKGVYRALHEHVVAMADADDDVVGVRLYVETENGGAQQTYEGLGMKRCGYFLYEQLV